MCPQALGQPLLLIKAPRLEVKRPLCMVNDSAAGKAFHTLAHPPLWVYVHSPLEAAVLEV